jgi:hypothetical protein
MMATDEELDARGEAIFAQMSGLECEESFAMILAIAAHFLDGYDDPSVRANVLSSLVKMLEYCPRQLN